MSQHARAAYAPGALLPSGRKLTARDPVFRENPHERFDVVRTTDPVHWDAELRRFVLTRAADIGPFLADRSLSSDPFKAAPDAFGRQGFRDIDRGKLSMLTMDDPDHSRIRGLVVEAFSARAVAALRPRVQRIAADLLGRIDPGGPFDLIASYAVPLPALVIAALLGVEAERVDDFKRWSDDFAIFCDPDHTEEERQRLIDSQRAFGDYLRRAVAARRERPRDDLIGEFVAAEQRGEKLTESEIVSTCRLLLAAGNLTTTDLIGNGVVALLRHPEQIARLDADPALWPAAIEEILRYDPPVTAVSRHVVADRRIGGCPIKAGQTVTAMLPAANRDPDLHDDPHRLDVRRERQVHHSFGGGAHFCLGAALARMEGQIAISALFARFPNVRLPPGRPLRRKAVPGFHGFREVWLRAS